jgi:hypothetical protein
LVDEGIMHGRPGNAARRLAPSLVVLAAVASGSAVRAQVSGLVPVEGQPLAENVRRVVRALESLGAPLPPETAGALTEAVNVRDASALQDRLDPHVLLLVTINPEERVKVGRGPAPALLQQGAYTPVLVKVVNEAATVKALRITSPQSGPVTAGAADLSSCGRTRGTSRTERSRGARQGDSSRWRWPPASP